MKESVNLGLRNQPLIGLIRDFWIFSEISKKFSKKSLTSFYRFVIELEKFNLLVIFIHKIQEERR